MTTVELKKEFYTEEPYGNPQTQYDFIIQGRDVHVQVPRYIFELEGELVSRQLAFKRAADFLVQPPYRPKRMEIPNE